MLRHPQDAEDVVQETFLKLLHHLRSGRNADNLRGWLFTVAAHAARDRQRRRWRWIPWGPDHEAMVEPASLPDEDGRLQAAREALQRLSGKGPPVDCASGQWLAVSRDRRGRGNSPDLGWPSARAGIGPLGTALHGQGASAGKPFGSRTGEQVRQHAKAKEHHDLSQRCGDSGARRWRSRRPAA